MNWWKRLIAEPTCPGCGTTFVTWTDTIDDQGWRTERKWYGCPRYRDAGYDESKRHAARWKQGKFTPLREVE